MRSVSIRIEADRGWFGPVHRGVVDSDRVAMNAVHQLRLLEDGTLVAMYECAGDPGALDAIIADHGDHETGDYLTEQVDERILIIAHRDPGPMLYHLVSLIDQRPIVIDWPITFPSDSIASMNIVGDRSDIRAIVKMIPDSVLPQIDRTGDFQFSNDRLVNTLTEREREIFLTACEFDYYQNPRESTYEEISALVDCSAGTVGNHLRNVETKILQALAEEISDEIKDATTPP